MKKTEHIKIYSPKYVIELARKFRFNMTPAEKKLWEVLQKKKLNGLRFRRQHPIGRYIADFYCHEKRLIVEVDGSIHQLPERMEYDKVRDELLTEMHNVLHLQNEDVLSNVEYCKRRIIEAAANKLSPPSGDIGGRRPGGDQATIKSSPPLGDVGGWSAPTPKSPLGI